ncbi:MAG: hypothetical protein ISS41_09100 [Candidatus Aminicenantes bacterium]|nr:hypothetical protein [Candidatus Aminicenantes bacterium]
MDYLNWNDSLVKHFFSESMTNREVLLYINDEVISQLGEPHGAGVDDFIEAVKKGPEWATKDRFCQKAWHTHNDWRKRNLEYPPYVGYLAFFVLAAVTETDYAPHSYYPRLRKRLGEPEDAGMPAFFDRMIDLWDDLEKWSREDKHEELGRFVARIRGGWIYVGLPRSQTILSENERKHLPNMFDAAGLDPTDPPSPEIIPKMLSYYGQSILANRTRSLLESTQADDDVLKSALVELVLDELEEWDGTIPEQNTREESPRKQVHTSLRLCIKMDPMASAVEIYVRFKSPKLFPEEGLHFTRSGDDHEWQCYELHRGWSTPLKQHRNDLPQKLDGALLDWHAGERLTDTEVHWRARLKGKDVRLFRLGIDGLPDWVETQRLERGIEFLVACKSGFREKIRTWGSEGCETFEQKNVTGLPSGWLLFHSKNASESCPGIDILTLSTTVRLHLEGGIKADKGNVYFKFAPPKIVLENSAGSEKVTVNGEQIEQSKNQAHVFVLPVDVPSSLPIRIEVDLGDHRLSKIIRLEEFDLPDSFDDTPFRNSKGDIGSNDMSVKACGADVYGIEQETHYQGPDLTLLFKKVIFIGEIPGEIAAWPDEPYPSTWHPVWAAVKRGRKNWEILYSGTAEQLKRVSTLPSPAGDRSQIKLWKKVIWHRRKRNTPPEIEDVRIIWNDYMRLAQHV